MRFAQNAYNPRSKLAVIQPQFKLGLLLFAESHQGRGLGKLALTIVNSIAHGWSCNKLRLAVVVTNVRALSFWSREGFRELFRRSIPKYTGEVIVMERSVNC